MPVERVLIARNADGPVVADILKAARKRGLDVRRVTPAEVTRLSRNARQDQGAVADVVAPAWAPWALPCRPARRRPRPAARRPDHRATSACCVRATAAGWEGIIVPAAAAPRSARWSSRPPRASPSRPPSCAPPPPRRPPTC
ncbi:MAG: RNA methyltransferase substrate-binding domain-containing protein [bacterium]